MVENFPGIDRGSHGQHGPSGAYTNVLATMKPRTHKTAAGIPGLVSGGRFESLLAPELRERRDSMKL